MVWIQCTLFAGHLAHMEKLVYIFTVVAVIVRVAVFLCKVSIRKAKITFSFLKSVSFL